jgi:hypothetical protein|tara:strand:+ start:867 stop:1031 length:165 start_codon:yes stop_codon:yes gene_type:complete
MNFLQKIVTRGILKSLEKLSKKDPIIRGKFEELGKISNDLAIAIEKNKKDRRGD